MKRFHSPGMQKLEASASKSAQPSAAKRGRGRPTGSGSRQQKPKTVAEKEAEAQRTQANNINQYLERDQHMLDDQASRRRKQANIGDERTSRRSSRRQEANGPEELAKRFLENAKYLEANYVHVHEEAGSENIPATLDDLPEEEENLNEAGRRLDAFISSASTQRIRNDYELRIKFDCKLYTNVGSLGQVFRLTGTQSELVPQGKIFLPLEMLFLSSPCSGLRCALLAHIARQKEGIQVPFEKFATMLCYIFQCRPDTLKIHQAHAAANSLMKILEAMAQHRVEDNTEVWSIQNANIIFLLDNCWPYMRFAGWLHSQLISLLQMLCRLYLDTEMVDFRHRLATVIQMLLTQLSTTAGDGSGKQRQPSLLSILHHFGTSALVQCVDGDLGRALQLFLLFIQFEQFGVHKVATALSILEHILHEDDECVEVDKEEHQEKLVETPPPESVSPPLSAVFSLLPRVVEKLKESKDSTTLYLTYNRLMDALTIDEHFLRSQTTQSLVMAESSYQEATSLLTKKNINDKMIDTRARSLHRIRDVLQTRRNTCTQGLHRGSTDGVRLSESKSDISSANRLTYASTLYDYSSSDEDREEGKN